MVFEKKFCLIVLISGEFSSFHRRSMILKLSEYVYPNKVIIINRPKDLFFTPIKKRNKLFQKRLTKLSENAFLYTPFIPLYDQLILKMSSFWKKINYFTFKKDLSQLVKSLEQDKLKKIVWTMHPDLNDFLEFISFDFLIYDCYDKYSAHKTFVGNPNEREKVLLKRADLTLTVSKSLQEEKLSVAPEKEVIYSPNAVDISIFYQNSAEKPQDLAEITGTIIGFAGNVKEMDLELMRFLAEKRPDLSFVYVGKLEPTFNKEYFADLENIYFLGQKKYEEIAVYIKYFRVGIIPYSMESTIVKNSSPMKMYEYLAGDLFVVTVPVPEIVTFYNLNPEFQERIKISFTKENFLADLEKFLALPPENLTKELAEKLSWQNRFNKIFSSIHW